MSKYAPMPNLEAVCIKALTDAGITAHSVIPADPVWPLCTVVRLGGVPAVRQKLDQANLQFDCWGTGDEPQANSTYGKAPALALANQARVVLLELEGTISEQFNASISGVDDWTGLTWLPDPKTYRARYIFGMTVTGSTTE